MSEERVVDVKDIQLLSILEEDSRTPWSRIARKLGVSETTVYLRVRKLIDMGVLEGFTIRVNTTKLGLSSVAYLLLKVRGDSLEVFRRSVSENPHVAEAYEVFAGEYNVFVKLIARSQEEIAEQVDRMLSTPGVQGALTIYSVKPIKIRSKLLEMLLKKPETTR